MIATISSRKAAGWAEEAGALWVRRCGCSQRKSTWRPWRATNFARESALPSLRLASPLRGLDGDTGAARN
eukprot:3958210-Prymnesium_polylepis.2